MTEKEIIDLYLGGLSMNEILPKTNFKSPTSILNILNKNNIPRRSKAGLGDSNLKHDYFKTIDTEAKAYLLGFIYADGSLNKREGSQSCIRIEINERDIFVLELFKKELCTSNKITKSRKSCVRTAIHSNKIFDDLGRYEIIPNKSFINIGLPILEEPFMSHFIRGLFDGNGWVYPRGKHTTFGVCGSEKSMNILNNYLRNKLDLTLVKVGIYEGKHPFFLYSSDKDIRKIYEYLYSGATIFMERKKEKFNI